MLEDISAKDIGICMNKSELYKLIDSLPAAKLPVARAYLEGLRAGAEDATSGLDQLLELAAEEDEEITSAEEAETLDAEADILENGTVSHEEALRFLAS